jgi:hypothetical protein
MTAEQVLQMQNVLATYFINGCSVYWTEAGLLVSGIRDNTTFEEAKDRVLDLIHDELVRYNEIIYRLFLYTRPEEQFRTEATLYTKASDFQGGMHTSYRQSTDADILMKEIDYEYLCLANRPTFQIEVKNGGTNFDIVDGRRYGELFVMGMSFGETIAHFQDNAWYIEFR